MSLPQPPWRDKLPVANGYAEMPRTWIKWLTDLANQAVSAAAAAVSWDSLSKTGSNITDIERRNHGDLQNIDTDDHAHLYKADRDQLVAGDDTTLHYHDSDRDSDNFTGTEWTDLTDAGVTSLHQHDFSTVVYPTSAKIGDPTHIDTLQEVLNHHWSSGIVDGCDLTDNGNGTVSIATGTGVIRASTDPHTTLYAIIIPAQANIALTDDAVNYIYIDYNSGTPQFVASTSVTSFNCIDKCIAYAVHRAGNVIHTIDAREQNVDGNRKMRQLFLKFARFIHSADGTALGSSGLAITVTSGSFFFMLQEITHIAFDTSVAGTANANVFTLWYQDGAGGWTETADQKTITTTTYDDASGTPATLGNNQFGVTWFYIINDAPSELHAVMGQAEYASLEDANIATPPTTIPSIVSGIGVLIGFVVYEKSATVFDNVLSAFTQRFSAGMSVTHNGLSGLQGGTTHEYYHLTSAQHTSLTGQLTGYTVATLPAGTVGDRAYVTDATAPTYLGALTGGGAVVCPVFRNATVWVSA